MDLDMAMFARFWLAWNAEDDVTGDKCRTQEEAEAEAVQRKIDAPRSDFVILVAIRKTPPSEPQWLVLAGLDYTVDQSVRFDSCRGPLFGSSVVELVTHRVGRTTHNRVVWSIAGCRFESCRDFFSQWP